MFNQVFHHEKEREEGWERERASEKEWRGTGFNSFFFNKLGYKRSQACVHTKKNVIVFVSYIWCVHYFFCEGCGTFQPLIFITSLDHHDWIYNLVNCFQIWTLPTIMDTQIILYKLLLWNVRFLLLFRFNFVAL